MVAAERGNPEADWYIEEYGGGVMVREIDSKSFGRVFVPADQLDRTEDLQFVARA